jgi:hypothetical protein
MVRVIKRAASNNALFPAANWDEWVPGKSSLENVSLPVDFQLAGLLLESIQIGQSIDIFRIERNGVYVVGFFQSSPVMGIDEFDRIITNNSVYQIEPFELHELKRRCDAMFQ